MDDVQIRYDHDADVLYASLGEPTPCHTRELGCGVLERTDAATGCITAVTIIGFREGCVNRNAELSDELMRLPAALAHPLLVSMHSATDRNDKHRPRGWLDPGRMIVYDGNQHISIDMENDLHVILTSDDGEVRMLLCNGTTIEHHDRLRLERSPDWWSA